MDIYTQSTIALENAAIAQLTGINRNSNYSEKVGDHDNGDDKFYPTQREEPINKNMLDIHTNEDTPIISLNVEKTPIKFVPQIAYILQ